MKKYIFLLLTILLAFSGNVFAQPKSGAEHLSEKEFIKKVKKADEYKTFKSYFLKDAPMQPKPLIDVSGSQYGWAVQYEMEYNEKSFFLDDDAIVNFSSLLSFSYEFDGSGLKARLVDYSRLMDDKAFYVKDLGTGEESKIEVSEDSMFQEYLAEVEVKKKQILEDAAKNKEAISEENRAAGELCYYCTKYEWRGGYSCAPAAMGSETSVTSQLAANDLNADAVMAECYVPRHKVCVQGEWRTYCPIQ
ncbi:hypothetical protein J7I93_19805 [Bacillus sp. ISL-47]|uniref:hypothetical protein n=1 Tax=Bacillus sp. ISL-47 TaxID=2819130 RepID=UPI001BEAFB8D|nr:hypothetical protein [Bacillus sp. ISL-47]MBT2690402.1 hypothetical protein [Bacillus sp. ISL-47]MBT2707485.1 hypothetical protein [Pseudomonas sp. ISL-84]